MSSTAQKQAVTPSFFSSPWLRWGLVALIQLGLIALPLVDRLQVQMEGQEVTLELVPIDPRDLLRGEYVILNLAAATLPKDLPGNDGTLSSGEAVFVSLEIGSDGIARPTAVHRSREEASSLALKGEVRPTWNDTVRLKYGLNAFYLPEGAGKEIEQLPRERVKLVISLHDDGRSMPLRLLIDGKPFESDSSF